MMYRQRFYLIIFSCLAVSACQSSNGASLQDASWFYRSFGLYQSVREINLPQLKCSASSTTGKISGGRGEAFYRNESSLNFEILDEAGLGFDELAFFTKLKAEIEHEIRGSGAKVNAGAISGPSLYCEYETNKNHGVLEVAATPTGPGRYRLTSVIRETMSR
jgi:hypothetical protein